MKKLTPWQKIVRAAKRGTGTRLTFEDCGRLWMDDAITTRAGLDDLCQPDEPANDLRRHPADIDATPKL